MDLPALIVLRRVVFVAFLILMPVLWIRFTDRFQQAPRPDQYATVFGIAGLAGILLVLPAISLIAVAALIAMGTAWLYAHVALRGVTYHRDFAPLRLFAGSDVDLTICVGNDKILPLSWLSIKDPVIARAGAAYSLRDLLRFSAPTTLLDIGEGALVTRIALAPFQELRREYRLTGLRRGVYNFGPAAMESGDPLGLFSRQSPAATRQEIIVYPRIYQPSEIGPTLRQVLGVTPARLALLDDPLLLAGAREYRPGDPLKRVHWKATARTGSLAVRVFDPSTTGRIMIVLNTITGQAAWEGIDVERLEAAISLAGSAAVWALEKGFPVGLRTNGIIAGEGSSSRVAPSAAPKQAAHLMEHLARIAHTGRYPPQALLLEEAKSLGERGSLIYVSPLVSPEVSRALTSPFLRGIVSVLDCGASVPAGAGVDPQVANAPEAEDVVR